MKTTPKNSRIKSRIVAALRKQHGDTCFYCRGVMLFDLPEGMAENEFHQHPDRRTIEHITPVVRGGTYSDGNIVLAHRRCNQEVGNLPRKKKLLRAKTTRAGLYDNGMGPHR